MLSVFEKLSLRDGLVWTVGPNRRSKLRVQISQAWCGRNIEEEMFFKKLRNFGWKKL